MTDLVMQRIFTDRALRELKRLGATDPGKWNFGEVIPVAGDFVTFPVAQSHMTLRVVRREFIFSRDSQDPQVCVEFDVPQTLKAVP